VSWPSLAAQTSITHNKSQQKPKTKKNKLFKHYGLENFGLFGFCFFVGLFFCFVFFGLFGSFSLLGFVADCVGCQVGQACLCCAAAGAS
jgi:hypothetical protein